MRTLIVVLCAMGFMGCQTTLPPRDVARGTMLVLVESVQTADKVCADIALESKSSTDPVKVKKAADAAGTCAVAKKDAIASIKVGRDLVDAWQAGEESKWGCAVYKSSMALKSMTAAILGMGGTLPAVVVDAIVNAERYLALIDGTDCK